MYRQFCLKNLVKYNMENMNIIFEPPYSYWLILGLGIILLLIIGNRRFKRRGLGGLQHFRNYYLGLLVLFLETIFSLVGFALIAWAVIMLLFG